MFGKYKNICSVRKDLIVMKGEKVDHDYVVETLRRYGFGPKHIRMFELIYKDISARILINGHLGESLSIKRGFKQGDSPSCGWFNICIDPLIRNVIADRNMYRLADRLLLLKC